MILAAHCRAKTDGKASFQIFGAPGDVPLGALAMSARHVNFAEGCHFYIAVTGRWRILALMENHVTAGGSSHGGGFNFFGSEKGLAGSRPARTRASQFKKSNRALT